MDALIFDFDGVVVDSEPVHLKAFQQVLRPAGIEMTRDDYYGKYLGFDDHDCFAAAAADNGKQFTEARIAKMIAAKTQLVQRAFGGSVRALSGAAELIADAAGAGVPLAICSGALREEIVLAARTVGVRRHFRAIVTAEDVRRGKPDPEGYALALERLARAAGRGLDPSRTVVVEDAPAGIRAAKALGMKVLAVTNSYSADRLAEADRVVDSLKGVTAAGLDILLKEPGDAPAERG